MKCYLIILCLVLCSFAKSDKRLISLSETEQHWLDQSDIDALVIKQVKFIDITDFQELGKSIRAPLAAKPLPNQPQFKELVNLLIPTLDFQEIGQTILSLGTYRTRYYQSDTGVAAAKYIYSKLSSILDLYPHSNVEIDFVTHTGFPQPSVVATILGNSEDEDIVVIGAHEDSVVSPVTGVSPGADDDGSGTATVIEIFRALVKYGYYPERTVRFYFYAAEEGGLLGSQQVVTEQAKLGLSVYGALQLDMTGYSGNNPAQPIGIITDFTDANLTQFVRILVNTYSLLPWVNSVCGYGCSDHASWTRAGYRSAFPFETAFPQRNPYIHSGADTLDKLDAKRLLEFAKIGLSFVVELGGEAFHTDDAKLNQL